MIEEEIARRIFHPSAEEIATHIRERWPFATLRTVSIERTRHGTRIVVRRDQAALSVPEQRAAA